MWIVGLVVLVIVAAPFAYRFSRWMVVLRMKRGNLRQHHPPKTDSAQLDRSVLHDSSRLRKLLDEGYSMTDLCRELDMTAQAIHDLLRRAKEV